MTTPSIQEAERQALDEKRKADIDHNNLLNDFKRVMSTTEGINVIRHILGYTQYRNSPFNKNAMLMSQACGRLDVGNYITGLMAEADTELYCKLMIFNQDNEQQDGGPV